jgi:ubiquinone biosynthesis protein
MTALSWSVLVIGAALTVLLFAFGVRRLIGVRVPPLRTLAAAIVAVLVFSPIVTAMIGGPGFPRKGSALPALWFVILGAVIALLAGMVFLVIAEALVPSGSVPGPVYVLRATRGRIGRAGRYGQISRILARRGLLPYQRGCCWPWTGATRPGWPTRCWKSLSGPGNWTSRGWNGCWAGSWPGTPDPGSPPT